MLLISIHSPRKQRDLRLVLCAATSVISIHSPRKQRDVYRRMNGVLECISIHSPRKQRDPPDRGLTDNQKHFNPLSAQAERLSEREGVTIMNTFQSTLRASRETFARSSIFDVSTTISIHSPRKQRDDNSVLDGIRLTDFNPLSAQAERPL